MVPFVRFFNGTRIAARRYATMNTLKMLSAALLAAATTIFVAPASALAQDENSSARPAVSAKPPARDFGGWHLRFRHDKAAASHDKNLSKDDWRRAHAEQRPAVKRKKTVEDDPE